MMQPKGFVTYIYKGAQYFEQPKRTHISRIEYNEIDNMSTVYLKHNKYFTEALCVLLLCILIYFAYAKDNYVQCVHMPNSVYYFDNKLYINILADKDNMNPVEYDIAGCSGVLNPGESLEYIDYKYDNQGEEIITYTVNWFGIPKRFTEEISIGILDFDSGGINDEGY